MHPLQVVSNRMEKSILVAVDKWKYIAKYKTRIKRTKKLMVRRPLICSVLPGQGQVIAAVSSQTSAVCQVLLPCARRLTTRPTHAT